MQWLRGRTAEWRSAGLPAGSLCAPVMTPTHCTIFRWPESFQIVMTHCKVCHNISTRETTREKETNGRENKPAGYLVDRYAFYDRNAIEPFTHNEKNWGKKFLTVEELSRIRL